MAIKDGDIIVIDRIEDDNYQGKEFKVVIDKDGNRIKIKYGREGALKAKWPLLDENVGKAIQLSVGYYNNVPFVKDFEVVGDMLPTEKGKETILPEHKQVIQEATKTTPAPQAVGMITKEIGDHIRKATLTPIFGKVIAIKLTEWYRSQVLGITRISCDSKDLPVYKAP